MVNIGEHADAAAAENQRKWLFEKITRSHSMVSMDKCHRPGAAPAAVNDCKTIRSSFQRRCVR
jgi:hypothetical protein